MRSKRSSLCDHWKSIHSAIVRAAHSCRLFTNLPTVISNLDAKHFHTNITFYVRLWSYAEYRNAIKQRQGYDFYSHFHLHKFVYSVVFILNIFFLLWLIYVYEHYLWSFWYLIRLLCSIPFRKPIWNKSLKYNTHLPGVCLVVQSFSLQIDNCSW